MRSFSRIKISQTIEQSYITRNIIATDIITQRTFQKLIFLGITLQLKKAYDSLPKEL